jgi:hypothetical protein
VTLPFRGREFLLLSFEKILAPIFTPFSCIYDLNL